MKKVLVFGASGAMGTPLIEILSENSDYDVYATSRQERVSDKIHWLRGDGHDKEWVESLFGQYDFDAIIDFLVYGTSSFKERYELLLSNTSHYIFLSSARVYAEYDGIIRENSPRILDVCQDGEYLAGDTYDLAKARQEDILLQSQYNNYTIIRPSLTYNAGRLQLTLFEKDEWMYRVFDGNSIIFPEEMRNVKTTMTYGKDVAGVIARLLFKKEFFGEIFNVSGGGCRSWGEVLDIYMAAIENCTHNSVKVCKVDGAEKIAKDLKRYSQYKYARGVSREFSNDKINNALGGIDWMTIENGLTQCVQDFFDQGAIVKWPEFRRASYFDRLVHEYTPLKRFDTLKHKAGYIIYRFGI